VRLARDNSTHLCAACVGLSRHRYIHPPQVPAEFWQEPGMAAALDSWHMGKVIRAFRLHPWHPRLIAQTTAGAWLQLNQTQLSRIETGPAPTDLAKLRHWAQALGVPADRLWFRVSSEPASAVAPQRLDLVEDNRRRKAKQARQTQNREAALATAYAEAHGVGGVGLPTGQEVLPGLVAAVGGELAGGLAGPLLYLALLSTPAQVVPIEWREQKDQLREQLRTFLRGWADTMDRRELLRLLGWVATTVAASPVSSLDDDAQERLGKAIAAPSRVDERTIDHIETMLQHCKRQEDTFGPDAVLHTVLAQRELVRSLLDECPGGLRSRLLSVHSSMSSSIGTYFFDLEDPASAMYYCDQARAAAQDARNTELGSYALCMMSMFASQQGKAHAGIDFAAAAQRLSGKTNDVLLQVCAAERAASAYAIDGQYKESMAEFDRAFAGLTASTGQRSPESPVYWFHEGLVASKQSDCLIRLGKPVEAIAAAERGLRVFDNSHIGSLAFLNLRLGTARLLCGEVEEAARVISEGALIATRYRSARLTGEVKAARGRMQPWHDTAAVTELDERLRGWGMGSESYVRR
jgi:transcriptional regulator with XRE-family HTH domain